MSALQQYNPNSENTLLSFAGTCIATVIRIRWCDSLVLHGFAKLWQCEIASELNCLYFFDRLVLYMSCVLGTTRGTLTADSGRFYWCIKVDIVSHW